LREPALPAPRDGGWALAAAVVIGIFPAVEYFWKPVRDPTPVARGRAAASPPLTNGDEPAPSLR